MIKIMKTTAWIFIFLPKVLLKYEKSSSFLKNKQTRHPKSTWHSFLSGWPHLIRKWKEEKHWKEETRKSDLSQCTAPSSGCPHCPNKGQRQQHILLELSGILQLGPSLRRNPMLKYWEKSNQVLLFNLFLSTLRQAVVSSSRNTGVRSKDGKHQWISCLQRLLMQGEFCLLYLEITNTRNNRKGTLHHIQPPHLAKETNSWGAISQILFPDPCWDCKAAPSAEPPFICWLNTYSKSLDQSLEMDPLSLRCEEGNMLLFQRRRPCACPPSLGADLPWDACDQKDALCLFQETPMWTEAKSWPGTDTSAASDTVCAMSFLSSITTWCSPPGTPN